MSNRRSRARKAKSGVRGPQVHAPDEASFVVPEESERAPAGLSGRLVPRLWMAARILCGAVLLLGVSGAVAFGAHRYALTTPRFAVQSIDVEGARRVGTSDVIELAGVKLGDNVFALEISELEQRLLANPWIAEARVTRRLPGAVRIEIQEREAGALVVLGERLFLATRSGHVFKAFEAGDPFDLPTVTGLRADALLRDRDRELERLELALDLLRQYEKVPLSHVFPAEEVHLDEGGGAVLTAGKQGLTLHLGSAPYKQKLLRATRVVERSQSRGQLPGILFLDNQAHPERVVVRMR